MLNRDPRDSDELLEFIETWEREGHCPVMKYMPNTWRYHAEYWLFKTATWLMRLSGRNYRFIAKNRRSGLFSVRIIRLQPRCDPC